MIAGVPYDAEVGWLQGDGNAYIDTGIKASSSLAVNCQCCTTSTSTGFAFGAREGATIKDFCLVSVNTYSRFDFGGVTGDSRQTVLPSIVGTSLHSISNNSTSVTIDGETIPLVGAPTEFAIDNNVVLFANNTNGTIVKYSNIRIGKYRLSDGTHTIDLIPVRVGQVGYMYDRVTKRLFGNQGTGSFIIGPDVAKPVMGLRRFKPTARNYVQDGLIAMWDGIENAGWGVHDPNATVWKDLVGSVDIPIGGTGISVGSDRVAFRDGAYSAITPGSTFKTEEVVCAGYSKMYQITQPAILSNNGWKLQFDIDTKRAGWGVTSQYNPMFWSGPGAAGVVFNTAISCDGATRKEYFAGSVFYTRSKNGNIPRSVTMARDNEGRKMDCDILCVRLYSRVLTADEIAANYAIDKVRFNL